MVSLITFWCWIVKKHDAIWFGVFKNPDSYAQKSCRPCFFFSKHEFTTSTTMVSLLRPQNSRCETALVWPLEPHGQVNLLSDFIGLSFKARNLGRCVVHLVLAKNAQCFKGYTDGSEKTNGKLYFPQNNVKCLDFFGEWFRTPCQRLLVTSNWIKSYF